MQPYQEASEEIRRQGEVPSKLLKTAGSVGGAYLGGIAFSRVLPFLSSYIPKDLAIKGMSKVDPRFGKFINAATSAGTSFDEIKDFIRGKAEESQQNKPNIIQQYSDDLHSFIDNQIKSGRKVLEAGALAQLNPSFKKVINKMTKDHNSTFSSILESVYGGGSTPVVLKEIIKEQTPDRQLTPNVNQQGPGATALLEAIQKLQQIRGSQ